MNHTPSRKLERVRVQSIQSLPGRRKINPETVSRLVESIGKIGLRTPITIRYVNAAPVLVTGAHRLAAVQELGWDQVECFVFCAGGGDETLVTRGDDEITAKLWEISENLHRAELTPLERSELIAEWIRLTDQKPSQVGTVSKGGRGKAGGVNAAARELGISKTAAHRAVAIDAMPAEAKQAARDSGLDRNQAALEKIAKADKPVQAVKAITKKSSTPKLDPVKAYEKARALLNDMDAQGRSDLGVRCVDMLSRDGAERRTHQQAIGHIQRIEARAYEKRLALMESLPKKAKPAKAPAADNPEDHGLVPGSMPGTLVDPATGDVKGLEILVGVKP